MFYVLAAPLVLASWIFWLQAQSMLDDLTLGLREVSLARLAVATARASQPSEAFTNPFADEQADVLEAPGYGCTLDLATDPVAGSGDLWYRWQSAAASVVNAALAEEIQSVQALQRATTADEDSPTSPNRSAPQPRRWHKILLSCRWQLLGIEIRMKPVRIKD